MPINLTRIPGLPDERVTDITVAPLWSGDALVSYMAADRLHYAYYWWETGKFKVLDDDLFDEDPRKDAGSGAVWDTPRGLACLVAHSTDATGSGASARMFGGTMDAPWVKDAREYRLTALIDERARAIVQSTIQAGSGEAGHADEELRAEIDRLKTEVTSLHGRIGELERLAMGTAEKVHRAGAALVGE